MRRPPESFAQLDPIRNRLRFGDYFVARSYAALAERFEPPRARARTLRIRRAPSREAHDERARPSDGGYADDAAHSRDVRAFAQGIRRIVLEQSMRAGVGHIGSALSVADIVAALYADVLASSDPRDPDRDRFVLSKGHASLAALRRALPPRAG